MKSKPFFLFLLLLVVLSGCEGLQESNRINTPRQVETVNMSFDSFFSEGPYAIISFIHNPRQNDLCSDNNEIFRFRKTDEKLQLESISCEDEHGNQGPFVKLEDSTYADKFNSGEYCSRAIAFLCNKNEIKARFHEKGIDNIQNIVIIDLVNYDEAIGYVIAAVTDKGAYYMTVPLCREKYGDYIFQKVYTSDEFLKIYSPRPAKVFINEKEVIFSKKPVLGDILLEMDLFEFLKALGYEYTYDEKLKKVVFGNFTIQFKKSDDSELFDILVTSAEYKNDCLGYSKYINGAYTCEISFYSTLCHLLGYSLDLHYDNYSVHIKKQKNK